LRLKFNSKEEGEMCRSKEIGKGNRVRFANFWGVIENNQKRISNYSMVV